MCCHPVSKEYWKMLTIKGTCHLHLLVCCYVLEEKPTVIEVLWLSLSTLYQLICFNAGFHRANFPHIQFCWAPSSFMLVAFLPVPETQQGRDYLSKVRYIPCETLVTRTGVPNVGFPLTNLSSNACNMLESPINFYPHVNHPPKNVKRVRDIDSNKSLVKEGCVWVLDSVVDEYLNYTKRKYYGKGVFELQ